ncbi:hypothetical protein EBR96_02110 [bacterium]|nr:hypothetical protein [bacterium]
MIYKQIASQTDADTLEFMEWLQACEASRLAGPKSFAPGQPLRGMCNDPRRRYKGLLSLPQITGLNTLGAKNPLTAVPSPPEVREGPPVASQKKVSQKKVDSRMVSYRAPGLADAKSFGPGQQHKSIGKANRRRFPLNIWGSRTRLPAVLSRPVVPEVAPVRRSLGWSGCWVFVRRFLGS